MINEIEKIIQNGESESVEFKKNFDNSVIISLNAFANTKGGKVILGIEDTGNIHGVKLNKETIQNWVHPIR
ncbi:MAG: putative DNA binding domain-containing protein [Melioribacteraceae bacterium]|nr:putative DNA binding domain-containing protein [Melioribacteraceae bacterium]